MRFDKARLWMIISLTVAGAAVIIGLLFTVACEVRTPKGAREETPSGILIGHNHYIGSIVRFEDGDIVCYVTARGISCLKR